MKKVTPLLLISFLLFFSISQTHAQLEYWGVTTKGGPGFNRDNGTEGMGVIFKTDKYGQNQQVLHNFDSATGFGYQHSLTQADNGKLYGIASKVGYGLGSGVLYEIAPVTGQYSVKKIFPGYSNNYFGSGGCRLLKAANGKLYGTRCYVVYVSGIDYGYTLLYSYDPATEIYTDVHTFNYQGSGEVVCITQGSNGKLYIPFQFGGNFFHNGALIEYDLATNTEVMVHDFLDLSGSMPVRNIIEWSPDIFYGCFTNGNTASLAKGGIYRFDATTRTYSIVAIMDSIGGDGPFCTLSRVGNKLYGATNLGSGDPDPNYYYYSGGIIFSFEPETNNLKKLYELNPPVNSPYYIDSLLTVLPFIRTYGNEIGRGVELLASNGLLYGLTKRSMFAFNPATNQFTNLLGLTSYKGLDPIGHLIEVCTKPYYTNYTADTITAAIGSPFSFTIHSKNAETFHWQKGASLINDTDSILSFTPFTITDTGRYTCQLTNECGSTLTKTIVIKVLNTNPVTLLSFTAILVGNNSLLQWQTSQELNCAYFNIQRSTDGINFTSVSRVNGSGTSAVAHSYQYSDVQTPEGTVYYRLQQADIDGKLSYSSIAVINNNKTPFDVLVNNPAHCITIQFSQATTGKEQINLFTVNGQLVKTQVANTNQLFTIYTQLLPAGVYQLQVITNTSNTTKKIIIEN